MKDEIKETGAAVESAAPKFTEKELIVMKLRHLGSKSGKGFRNTIEDSSSKSNKRSRLDALRISNSYQEHVDRFYELSLEDLAKMIRDGYAYETTEDTGAKKLTGSPLNAFRDAYSFKLQEKANKDLEEAKLKAEVEIEDAKLKAANIDISKPKTKKSKK